MTVETALVSPELVSPELVSPEFVSPAFVDEMTAQVRAAHDALSTSLAEGDEVDVAVAQARIAELEELFSRAADVDLRSRDEVGGR